MRMFSIVCLLLLIQLQTQLFSMTNLYGDDLFEPIEHALRTDLVEPIRNFIRRNTSNITDHYGWTLLHKAAQAGAPAITRYLLSLPESNPNIQEGSAQKTPLHIAITTGHDAVALVLIADSKTDVNSKNIDQETPLHHAVSLNKAELTKALLCRPDIQVNSIDILGDTPLHRAAQRGFTELAKLLLQAGADTQLVNKQHKIAAQVASQAGHKTIVDSVAQFNQLKNQLFDAIKQNNIPEVKKLLQVISIARITDAQGNTPLHLATKYANKELMASLFYVTPQAAWHYNIDRETPIHTAAAQPDKLAVFLPKYCSK